MTDNAGLVERLRRADLDAINEAAQALTAAEAEIARLSWENTRLAVENDRMEVGINAAEAALTETRAMLAEAVEALGPFAREANVKDWLEMRPGESTLAPEDFDRARSLANTKGSEDDR